MLLRRSFVQQGGRNGAARRPKGWSSPADTCRAAFSCRRAKKPPLMLSGGQTVKGPRRVCACGRKESPIIFFGDMCGEENTSRPANVRAVRRRRTARALQSGRKPFVKKESFLTASKNGMASAMPFFVTRPPRRRARRGRERAGKCTRPRPDRRVCRSRARPRRSARRRFTPRDQTGTGRCCPS